MTTDARKTPLAGWLAFRLPEAGSSVLLRPPVVCLALALLVLAIYFPVVTFDFAHMDDGAYIRTNPVVLGGVTSRAALDAFQVFHKEYWVPVLWFSFMLDAEIFGTGPGGFHLTNVILHICNVILLFLLARRLTSSALLGFITAALFAAHPQRVESVAWITARKDVLYTLFLLLAVFAYLQFVESGRKSRLALAAGLQLLSLMAKPAALTLPGLLLALDVWPLGRWRMRKAGVDADPPPVPFKALVLEKWPFWGLSAAFTLLSVWIQRGSIYPMEGAHGLLQRVGMSALAFLVYLKNLLWPTLLGLRFSVSNFPMFEIVAGLLLFSCLCLAAFLAAKRWPHLTAGWIWFVAALLPISGIVAAGSQWLSDRFTYVPHMLLLCSFVVAGRDAAKNRRTLSVLGIALTLLLTLLWGDQSRKQLWTWKDPLSLALRSVAIAPWHAYAKQFLGQAYVMVDDPVRAVETFKEVIREVPEDHDVHFRMAYAYSKMGRIPEAALELRETIRYKPDFSDAYYHLAEFLYQMGEYGEAAQRYETFLGMVPEFLDRDYLHSRIGYSRLKLGQTTEAERHFRMAMELAPGNAEHHFNLALALVSLGRGEEALDQFQRALVMDPDDLQTRLTLAETLFLMGRTDQARSHFATAGAQATGKAEESFARGRVLEMEGKRDEAVKAYREGLSRKPVLPEVMENLEDSLAAPVGSKRGG